MRVERTNDHTRIEAFLNRDRVWGAYALGDLEPSLFDLCEWTFAVEDTQDVALALLFSGLTPPICLTIGTADGVASLVTLAALPDWVHFVMEPGHRSVVEEAYTLEEGEVMLRMGLAREDFRPTPPRDSVPRRLTSADMAVLMQLYASGAHDTPDAFAPFQVEQGLFYGAEENGCLVAVAGTHLVAPGMGVAAVGNVYTAPEHRGRGLAQVCTSAVVTACHELGVRDVVLNVACDNAPARAAYTRLGFRPWCEFIEVSGVRRP
ncbi:MAG: GNAT family N-acetyltransferase [Anaerolineae bacterium]